MPPRYCCKKVGAGACPMCSYPRLSVAEQMRPEKREAVPTSYVAVSGPVLSDIEWILI